MVEMTSEGLSITSSATVQIYIARQQKLRYIWLFAIFAQNSFIATSFITVETFDPSSLQTQIT